MIFFFRRCKIRVMEIEQSGINLAKRIIDLEAQCEQLKEEKNKLMEQMMGLKDKEEKTKDKYVKWKKKSVELKEKFDSEGRKWKEELEKSLNKYRQLEVEKRQLQIDFKAAQNGNEGTEKLRAEAERLKILLEEAEGRITTLVAKNDSLERHYSILEKDFQAKLVMEAKKQKVEEEKKIFELCQMIQDLESKKGGTERSFNVPKVVKSEKKNIKQSRKKINEFVENIEREKSEEINRILNENMALKEEHKKKILDLVLREGVLEREKRRLEAESRKTDEKIMKLVQEKERLAAKKKKKEMEMNRRAVKSEGAIELQHPVHPTSNLAILDTLTPSINQGEKSAIFPHSDEHQRSLNYGATASNDSKNEDNTMTTSANGRMRKRPSPENLSGGDSFTAKRTRPSI